MKYFRKPDYLIPGVWVFVLFMFLTIIPGMLLYLLTFGWFRYPTLANDVSEALIIWDIKRGI